MKRQLHANEEGFWRWRVLLNGEPVDRVWSADAGKGLVEVVLAAADGTVPHDQKARRPPLRTLHGRVVIELRAGLQAPAREAREAREATGAELERW